MIMNLLEYESFVLNSIEDGNQVDSIHTDFSKAFDHLRHQLLLLNEISVGIEPARCMWLGSYLSGRIQKIRIDDAVSKKLKVTSGVSHGSHLVCQQNIGDSVRVLFYTKALFSCQWILGVFENSVGFEQTVGVVRQKFIAP
jgi:hypothetical protein